MRPLTSDEVEKPGPYWYQDDAMGSPREKVQVVREGGVLYVRFRDDELVEPPLIDLMPLAGNFTPI